MVQYLCEIIEKYPHVTRFVTRGSWTMKSLWTDLSHDVLLTPNRMNQSKTLSWQKIVCGKNFRTTKLHHRKFFWLVYVSSKIMNYSSHRESYTWDLNPGPQDQQSNGQPLKPPLAVNSWNNLQNSNKMVLNCFIP